MNELKKEIIKNMFGGALKRLAKLRKSDIERIVLQAFVHKDKLLFLAFDDKGLININESQYLTSMQLFPNSIELLEIKGMGIEEVIIDICNELKGTEDIKDLKITITKKKLKNNEFIVFDGIIKLRTVSIDELLKLAIKK